MLKRRFLYSATVCGILLIILPYKNVLAKECVDEECHGNGRKMRGYQECTIDQIPSDGKITSVNVKEDYTYGVCDIDQTFGFVRDKHEIWASGGCNAEFTVCFETDFDDEPVVSSTTIEPFSIFTSQTTTNNGSKVNATTVNEQSRRKYTTAASIIGGVVGGLVFLVILCVVVCLILKRFPSCRLKQRQSEIHNHHRNVTFSISGETTLTVANDDNGNTYNTLDDYCRNTHPYQELSPLHTVPENSKPHMYTTIYDSFDESEPKNSTKNDTTHNYFTIEPEVDTEPETKSSQRYHKLSENETKNNKCNQSHKKNKNETEAYTVLDSNETGFYKGKPTNVDFEQDDKSKSDAYTVLDSNETGFYKGMPSSGNSNIGDLSNSNLNTISNDSPTRQFCYGSTVSITENGRRANSTRRLKSSEDVTSTNAYSSLEEGVYNISNSNKQKDDNQASNTYNYPSDFTYTVAQHSDRTRKTDPNYTLC